MRRHWLIVAFILIGLPTLAVLADRRDGLRWVGSTDLEVQFLVTNAQTEEPIPDAVIDIDSEGGFYEGGRESKRFQLITRPDGLVIFECPDNRCVGSESGCGWRSSRYVYPPSWRFKVTANGYAEKDWELIHDYHREGMKQLAPRRDLFLVHLRLEPAGN